MKKNKYPAFWVMLLLAVSVIQPVMVFGQTPPYNPSPDKSFEIFEVCAVLFSILALLYTIITVFRIRAENKIRQQLIGKGIAEDTLKQMLMNGNQRLRLEALRWGLIIGCTGIGLAICQYVVFSFMRFAVLFICISIALVLFYYLTGKKTNHIIVK